MIWVINELLFLIWCSKMCIRYTLFTLIIGYPMVMRFKFLTYIAIFMKVEINQSYGFLV